MNDNAQKLRHLPAIDTLLKETQLQTLMQKHHRDLVVNAARETLDDIRASVLHADASVPPIAEIVTAIETRLAETLSPTLKTVINATGVIVHTNLGRSLLSERAQKAMVEAAQGYNNLEYDLDAGKRGSRYHHAEALLCRLTGAEAAVVVNNNAAALVLALSTIAREKEVLINRSQLIEIGGKFRIPDIMAQSGATLVEVGTTNKTYIEDYEDNLHTVNTGLILRVHHSNFKIVGFTSEPTLDDLVDLGMRYGIPVMDDLGSGTLLNTEQFGLAHEPTIQESLAAGVSIVTASGDKLLGGPQAGIILGKADIIERIKKNPLTRAFRVDKVTLAALQATLLAYLENNATEEIPTWRMVSADTASLNRRAKRWQRALSTAGISARVIDSFSTVGGGSLPGQQFPTRALAIKSSNASALSDKLRAATPPVITRVENEEVIFDPRTVLPTQDKLLVKLISDII